MSASSGRCGDSTGGQRYLYNQEEPAAEEVLAVVEQQVDKLGVEEVEVEAVTMGVLILAVIVVEPAACKPKL